MPAAIALKVDVSGASTQEMKTGKKKNIPDKSGAKGPAEKPLLNVKKSFNKLLEKEMVKIKKKGNGKIADKKISREKGKENADAAEQLAVSFNLKTGKTEKTDEKKELAVPEIKKTGNEKTIQASKITDNGIQSAASAEMLKAQFSKESVKITLNDKKDDTGKKAAAKKTEKDEKNEEKLQVLDLRAKEIKKEAMGDRQFTMSKSDSGETPGESRESSSDNISSKEVLMLRPGDNSQGTRADTPVKSLTAEQNTVFERLKAEGNSEIVKQTKIILKDESSGELKMLLKPEKLGYVRIRINLNDNNIVGRIIVDNNSIKEIFESNMENLIRNFRESGFNGASLEVSVGGGKNQGRQMESNERFFSEKIIEDVQQHNIVGINAMDNSLINLVV